MNAIIKKTVKYVLFYLLLVLSKTAIAQKFSDSLQVYEVKDSIDAKLLVGFWETIDSLKNRIEFVDSGFQIILNSQNKFYPYSFLKDSQNRVPAYGYYALWPPPSCKLNLLNAETLEISCSSIGVPTYVIKYKKIH